MPLLILLLFLRSNTPMTVNISGIHTTKGQICLAVFNRADGFLKPEAVYMTKILPVRQNGTVDVSFPELPDGWYAISCFHDLNGNGKLDTNLFGIPTEPYGFSNGARPKFRAPTWEEARFWYQPNGKNPCIRLETW
jgi:uncharacterized protein (DUF2141 family)